MPALTFSVNSLFSSLRSAARVFDDVDAAGELAGRVRQHLAVLARDRGDELVGMLLQQRLEAEHDAGASKRRRRGPCRECGLRRFDGSPDLGGGRERNARAQRAGRGCEDIAEAAGRSGRTLAADPMGERGDIGLSQCGRGSHGSISGRSCAAAASHAARHAVLDVSGEF
jgi:hypothetical protein